MPEEPICASDMLDVPAVAAEKTASAAREVWRVEPCMDS